MNGHQLYRLAEKLAPLSGMKYHGGKYTAPEWLEKTGTDPREFPIYIRITQSGLCVWTAKAESLYQSYCVGRRSGFAALGIVA
jgi:hypothetical protein